MGLDNPLHIAVLLIIVLMVFGARRFWERLISWMIARAASWPLANAGEDAAEDVDDDGFAGPRSFS